MKSYIKPSLKTKNIVMISMMAMSAPLKNGGGYTEGSVEADANSRRGQWGNLWDEE